MCVCKSLTALLNRLIALFHFSAHLTCLHFSHPCPLHFMLSCLLWFVFFPVSLLFSFLINIISPILLICHPLSFAVFNGISFIFNFIFDLLHSYLILTTFSFFPFLLFISLFPDAIYSGSFPVVKFDLNSRWPIDQKKAISHLILSEGLFYLVNILPPPKKMK